MGAVYIPSQLSDVIEFVSGISDFFVDTKFKPISPRKYVYFLSFLMICRYNPNGFFPFNITDPLVTPYVLHKKYGIPMSTAISNADNGLGIAAFQNAFSEEGLCTFQQLFPSEETGTVTWQGPAGGSDQVESDLGKQLSI
jgi:hypothetical protein